MSKTFIHEMPLQTTPHDEAALDVRLDAARQLYNACLGEALRRLDLMRESKAYRAARKLKKSKDRNELFKAAKAACAFDEYSIHAFAAKTKNACWIGDHLDINTAQKVASRAFNAVEKHIYKGHGRPGFSRYGEFVTVEGKNNTAGIRWREGLVHWSGLKFKPLFDLKDTHGVEAHALACRVKYLRLVKQTLKGKPAWYVQLVLAGVPHQKAKNLVVDAVSGLDIGPSSMAALGEEDALLTQFCDEVIQPWQELKIDQRAQDRSRRATNPENYNEDGTVKKGSRKWHRSNRYKKRQNNIAEKQRVIAATRKKQHGTLANKVISIGKHIKTEKLSYKSFQKNYGRSVAVRAPGKFVAMLTRKAENVGGSVTEIATQSTKLSQTCICGVIKKKPLKLRIHLCECGVEAQRDLFSAFLAKHCDHKTLDIRQAETAWPAAKPLLQRAISRLIETASRGPRPASFGLSKAQRQSCLPVKDGSTFIEVADVVARRVNAGESRKEMLVLPSKPPGFIHGVV